MSILLLLLLLQREYADSLLSDSAEEVAGIGTAPYVAACAAVKAKFPKPAEEAAAIISGP